jgi:hypothetical protein
MRVVPRLCEFYPDICLTTKEKALKNLSQGKKNHSQVNKNLSQSTIYILPKTPTQYKTLKNTHITKQYKTTMKLIALFILLYFFALIQ